MQWPKEKNTINSNNGLQSITYIKKNKKKPKKKPKKKNIQTNKTRKRVMS